MILKSPMDGLINQQGHIFVQNGKRNVWSVFRSDPSEMGWERDAHVRCAAQTPSSLVALSSPSRCALCKGGRHAGSVACRCRASCRTCELMAGLRWTAVEGPRVLTDKPPWRCYGPMLTHSRSDGDFPVYTRGERLPLIVCGLPYAIFTYNFKHLFCENLFNCYKLQLFKLFLNTFITITSYT